MEAVAPNYISSFNLQEIDDSSHSALELTWGAFSCSAEKLYQHPRASSDLHYVWENQSDGFLHLHVCTSRCICARGRTYRGEQWDKCPQGAPARTQKDRLLIRSIESERSPLFFSIWLYPSTGNSSLNSKQWWVLHNYEGSGSQQNLKRHSFRLWSKNLEPICCFFGTRCMQITPAARTLKSSTATMNVSLFLPPQVDAHTPAVFPRLSHHRHIGKVYHCVMLRNLTKYICQKHISVFV